MQMAPQQRRSGAANAAQTLHQAEPDALRQDFTLLLFPDVLSYLLTFILPWPRVFVVSLVCKRCRRVVLASITELPRLTHPEHASPDCGERFARIARLFPSLAELSLRCLPPGL